MASVFDIITGSWTSLTLFTLCTVVFLILVLVAYSVSIQLPSEFYYDERPFLPILYLRALCVGLKKKQGVYNGPGTVKRNDFTIIARDCRLSAACVRQYAGLVGHRGDTVPPCYLECCFLPLLLSVVTADAFRLSPLGLIHLAQEITQHAVLGHLLREPCDLEVTVREYRETSRGIEVDIAMKIAPRIGNVRL